MLTRLVHTGSQKCLVFIPLCLNQRSPQLPQHWLGCRNPLLFRRRLVAQEFL